MYKIIGADGKEYGPVSIDQLRDWLAQGRINAQTRVKPVEIDEWKAAAEVPELAALLRPPEARAAGQAPPPILTPPKLPARDNGLAILSFVLGLCSFVVCLGVLTGIPAIICGHIARSRATRQPARYGGSGLATAGLVLGYLSIVVSLVVAAMVLPELAKVKRRTVQKTGCEYNMRQVGLAFKVWALDHNDQFPFNVSTNAGGTLELCAVGRDGFDKNAIAHFQVISNELTRPGFLVCPNDRAKQPAINFDVLQQLNVSYRLRTGTNINTENPQEILAVCPIHGNELYCDGNVRKARNPPR
jgi:competence protein ComGC